MLRLPNAALVLLLAGSLMAACASDAGAPENPPGARTALDPTAVAQSISSGVTQAANRQTAEAAATAVAVPDGTYLFVLDQNGIDSELLLSVQEGRLAVAQLDLGNKTGSAIIPAPELTITEGDAPPIRAFIEQAWNATYAGTGLASGRAARMQISFPRPFNPTASTLCLRIANLEIGCYTRSR